MEKKEAFIQDSNFMMLTENLYKLFIRFLKSDCKIVPKEGELLDMLPSFREGAKNGYTELKEKFKAWAKRMFVENGDLKLKKSGKVIIPLEKCDDAIMVLHSEGHIPVGTVIKKIQNKYTWGLRNFGMDLTTVEDCIIRNCPKEICKKKIRNTSELTKTKVKASLKHGDHSFHQNSSKTQNPDIAITRYSLRSTCNMKEVSFSEECVKIWDVNGSEFAANESYTPINDQHSERDYSLDICSYLNKSIFPFSGKKYGPNDNYDLKKLIEKAEQHPMEFPMILLEEKTKFLSLFSLAPKEISFNETIKYKELLLSNNDSHSLHENMSSILKEPKRSISEFQRTISKGQNHLVFKEPKNIYEMTALIAAAEHSSQFSPLLSDGKTKFFSSLGLAPTAIYSNHTITKFREELGLHNVTSLKEEMSFLKEQEKKSLRKDKNLTKSQQKNTSTETQEWISIEEPNSTVSKKKFESNSKQLRDRKELRTKNIQQKLETQQISMQNTSRLKVKYSPNFRKFSKQHEYKNFASNTKIALDKKGVGKEFLTTGKKKQKSKKCAREREIQNPPVALDKSHISKTDLTSYAKDNDLIANCEGSKSYSKMSVVYNTRAQNCTETRNAYVEYSHCAANSSIVDSQSSKKSTENVNKDYFKPTLFSVKEQGISDVCNFKSNTLLKSSSAVSDVTESNQSSELYKLLTDINDTDHQIFRKNLNSSFEYLNNKWNEKPFSEQVVSSSLEHNSLHDKEYLEFGKEAYSEMKFPNCEKSFEPNDSKQCLGDSNQSAELTLGLANEPGKCTQMGSSVKDVELETFKEKNDYHEPKSRNEISEQIPKLTNGKKIYKDTENDFNDPKFLNKGKEEDMNLKIKIKFPPPQKTFRYRKKATGKRNRKKVMKTLHRITNWILRMKKKFKVITRNNKEEHNVLLSEFDFGLYLVKVAEEALLEMTSNKTPEEEIQNHAKSCAHQE